MHVNSRGHVVCLVLGTVLILAACSGSVPTTIPASTPTMAPTPGRTATPEPAQPRTPFLNPTFVPTPTPAATPALQPTVTPRVVPTSTPLPTPAPTYTLSPTPTSIARPTLQPILKPRVDPTSTPLPSPSPTQVLVPTPTAVALPTAQPTVSTKPTLDDDGAAAEPQGPPQDMFLPFRIEDVGGGNEFISPFGIIRHSRDAGHGHGGIDIPLNQNAPLYAVAEGTILSAVESSDGAGGFDVKLLVSGSGGEGWGFLYEHMNLEAGIDVGSTVTRGGLIGRNGLITDRRNSHLQLTYLFNDYKFSRDSRCWVDHLDASSKKGLLDYFDSIKTTEKFIAQWESASEEGMKALSELLNIARFPEGPQLCYPLGLDVRIPE